MRDWMSKNVGAPWWKLPEKRGTLTLVDCINSRLLPAVAGRNRVGETPGASGANVNIARPMSLSASVRYRIGFQQRISCEIFQSFVGRHVIKLSPMTHRRKMVLPLLNFTIASSITHSRNIESCICFRIENNREKTIFAG